MTRQSQKTREKAKPQPVEETGGAVRTIKKYPNRRLYDTGASRYVTVADLRELIRAQEAFLVQDAKTGVDMTRGVLLQILLELEASDAPMFSDPVLSDLIRLYSHPHQGRLREGLERNIGAIMQSTTDSGDGDGKRDLAWNGDAPPPRARTRRAATSRERTPRPAPTSPDGGVAAA